MTGDAGWFTTRRTSGELTTGEGECRGTGGAGLESAPAEGTREGKGGTDRLGTGSDRAVDGNESGQGEETTGGEITRGGEDKGTADGTREGLGRLGYNGAKGKTGESGVVKSRKGSGEGRVGWTRRTDLDLKYWPSTKGKKETTSTTVRGAIRPLLRRKRKDCGHSSE